MPTTRSGKVTGAKCSYKACLLPARTQGLCREHDWKVAFHCKHGWPCTSLVEREGDYCDSHAIPECYENDCKRVAVKCDGWCTSFRIQHTNYHLYCENCSIYPCQ